MELEVEGRRPVGRPKKTWSKVLEEDMRKLNITEDMTEDRKQWKQLISSPTPCSVLMHHGTDFRIGTLNEDDDTDDNDDDE